MISKLIKQHELKKQVAKIQKDFKIATKFTTRTDVVKALRKVFLKLRKFERIYKNTFGYTSKIENAVSNLYQKIDLKYLEYSEHYDKFYYKQSN